MIRLTTPVYPPYFSNYLAHYPDGIAPVAFMHEQLAIMEKLFTTLPAPKHDYAYAPGKWTVKQMLGHLADAERVFAYRAMCFARADKNNLPGFEEDDYVREGDFNSRTLPNIWAEFKAARMASIGLVDSFTPAQLARVGNANLREVSVEAICHIIPAHVQHHLNVLKERYGIG
jgi:hypothetical protein